MKASDAIFDIVKRYADTVFFVPGGGAMHLVDSLGKSGLAHISMLHEQGAAFAACGYAQYRKSLGVCLVTTGPGATNALTGCAAAWMDSLPVLFISGQAKTTTLIGDTGLRVHGVQEVDIIPMVKPITKSCLRWNKTTVWDMEHLEIAVVGKVNACLEGRPGPCWIDVPLDIQAEEVNE